ncbi:MAG: pyrimidine-nucleoside phosphorylase [Chloroflexi bacterium]|nr:MAG: pyrimidine-nucleoside phosphorylase [Chloroflexota bacterium]
MNAVDIITRKRDGLELTEEEIKFFVNGYTKGDIPDYQAAAWCMAVYFQGMTDAEATTLTLTMARSGDTLDLHQIAPFVVDKHSTGGVGDKTTLVVAPLVACHGLPVGKMSGRGLGFSGGTIDKLESIRGFNVSLTTEEFMEMLARHGIVVSGQSADLAPADGKFYALRDVTATVESLPLIAASIMSKKIAAGADAIVLDVKVGRGAFMHTVEDAEALARLMVSIGRGVGRKVAAVLSDMNQPLGQAVGNALEVKEAIETLHGRGPADFRDHCLTIAGKMVELAGKAASLDEARQMMARSLDSGQAWDKFVEWITAQGGDRTQLEQPDLLPAAPLVETVTAPRAGYVALVDAAEVGKTGVDLGAGRRKKGDPIDYGVGIIVHAKVGDRLSQGDPLFTIHASDRQKLSAARQRLLAAVEWSDTPVAAPPHTIKIIE